MLGALFPSEDLMKTLTDRKMAQEQQKTYEVQCEAQTKRQELVRQTALANIQEEMVSAEQSVKIAESRANATVKEAAGEAEATRLTGEAKADAYHAGVNALEAQAYTTLQLMQVVGDLNVRVVPDVSVSGGGNGAGLVDALLGTMMWQQSSKQQSSGYQPQESQSPAAICSAMPTGTSDEGASIEAVNSDPYREHNQTETNGGFSPIEAG